MNLKDFFFCVHLRPAVSTTVNLGRRLADKLGFNVVQAPAAPRQKDGNLCTWQAVCAASHFLALDPTCHVFCLLGDAVFPRALFSSECKEWQLFCRVSTLTVCKIWCLFFSCRVLHHEFGDENTWRLFNIFLLKNCIINHCLVVFCNDKDSPLTLCKI